jgi:segregation and condensation protein B
MEEYKNRVEAILFTTGRFMDMQEIASLCSLGSVGVVRDALELLKKDYESRSGSLTLVEENGKWKLGLKKDYNYITTKLLDTAEMDRPTQETLALIAYKNPALQSEIVKMRGNTSYDHIKFLKENDFIISEKQGRTRLLKLAPKFFDYFDVVENELKSKLSSKAPVEQPQLQEFSPAKDQVAVKPDEFVSSGEQKEEGDGSGNTGKAE